MLNIHTTCTQKIGINLNVVSVNTFLHSDSIPVPKVLSSTSVHKGRGIRVRWELPLDVSSVLVEGFLVAYRRCGFDASNTVKLVPGSDSNLQVGSM